MAKKPYRCLVSYMASKDGWNGVGSSVYETDYDVLTFDGVTEITKVICEENGFANAAIINIVALRG